MQLHRRATLMAILVTALWSSSWVIIRIGFAETSLRPLGFAGLRYGMAALVLWCVVLVDERIRTQMKTLRPAQYAALMALGVVFYAVTQGAQFVALAHQPAATTSLVLSFTPILVAAVSGIAAGEPPSRRQWGSVVLVVGGAVLYFAGSLGWTVVGMLAATIGLVANVASSILGRRANRDLAMSPVVVTAVSMTVGAGLLLVVSVAAEGMPALGATALLIVGWLALVNTALAFAMWNASLQHLTATESAVINNTMLIQIAVLAWIILDEVPDLWQMFGIVVVSGGVLLSVVGGGGVALRPWPRRSGGRTFGE